MASHLPSLGSSLDSALAKLNRANQHIRALKASLKRFGVADRYQNGCKLYEQEIALLPARVVRVPAQTKVTLTGVHYVEAGFERLFIRSLPFVLTLAPKGDFSAQYLRWGILIGEVVHNIGSALDNLAWELAQPLPPPPPLTASSKIRANDWRRRKEIGFPYTKERKDWYGNCARSLHFVTDPAVRTVLEEAQAFYAWEQTGADPDTFPFELIHELWNRDKHRTVNVGVSGLKLQVPNVRIPDLFPSAGKLPSKVIKTFPLRPLNGETEMAVIRVDLPQEIEFPQSGDIEATVYVQPKYTLTILFGEGSSAEGANAIEGLQDAHKLATQLINEFL